LPEPGIGHYWRDPVGTSLTSDKRPPRRVNPGQATFRRQFNEIGVYRGFPILTGS
jgi:hypothetical protein